MKLDYHKKADAKGLKCPQPLLLTQHAIKQLESGQVLLLEATDPGTDLDLEVWCERFGHEMVQTKEKGKVYRFWIKKN